MSTFTAVCAVNIYYLFYPESYERLIDELNEECIAEFGHPILEKISDVCE